MHRPICMVGGGGGCMDTSVVSTVKAGRWGGVGLSGLTGAPRVRSRVLDFCDIASSVAFEGRVHAVYLFIPRGGCYLHWVAVGAAGELWLNH
jgi:hypothetical protein